VEGDVGPLGRVQRPLLLRMSTKPPLTTWLAESVGGSGSFPGKTGAAGTSCSGLIR